METERETEIGTETEAEMEMVAEIPGKVIAPELHPFSALQTPGTILAPMLNTISFYFQGKTSSFPVSCSISQRPRDRRAAQKPEEAEHTALLFIKGSLSSDFPDTCRHNSGSLHHCLPTPARTQYYFEDTQELLTGRCCLKGRNRGQGW